MRYTWLFLALLLGCHDEVGELPRAEPASLTDPRAPSGFDVPLPTGLMTRGGVTRAGRSTVLATTEGDEGEVRDAVRAELSQRGWSLRDEDDTVVASVNGHERARVRVTTGLSGLIRVEASEARAGNAIVAREPRAWRRVTRAPLPAPPGGPPEPRCVAAIEAACAEYVAHTEDDPLDCRMDHRGVCVFVTAPAYHELAARDAEIRLGAAMRCYDQVLSDDARAETEALVQLERRAASAVAARSRCAGTEPSPSLLARLSASAGLDPRAPATTDWWSEIPEPSEP
ncbi:MAG: hypothetical protein AB8I08_15600 [Sandaracinaceae bacterium]